MQPGAWKSHVCIFLSHVSCREIWSYRQHPVYEGRLLCAALCFHPVHERNCNYGAQPPPLTHANMHYNWPIHTGKCLLNGLLIFSQQLTITYKWIFSETVQDLFFRLSEIVQTFFYHTDVWFEMLFWHNTPSAYIRPTITEAIPCNCTSILTRSVGFRRQCWLHR